MGSRTRYFHVQRDGHEHHVFMNNPLTAPIGSGAVFFGGKPAPKRKLYGELTQRMLKLDQAPMLVTYQSLQQIPGFRVVHAKESGEITSLANSSGQLFAGVSISDDRPIQWHAVHDSGLSHKSELRPYDPFQADIPGYYNWHKADLMISEGRLAGKRLWAGRERRTISKRYGFQAKAASQIC